MILETSIRPKLLAFTLAQERVLMENDHKGGWGGMSDEALISRLYEEVGELHRELMVDKGEREPGRILREANDVSNFAMFIADNAGELPSQEDEVGRLRRELLRIKDIVRNDENVALTQNNIHGEIYRIARAALGEEPRL